MPAKALFSGQIHGNQQKKIHYEGEKSNPGEKGGKPFIIRDYNKCVLCGKCIRVCEEVQMGEVLSIKYRGHEAIPGIEYDKGYEYSNCVFCGQCVSVCPVGAIIKKRIGFALFIWLRNLWII